MQKKVSAHLASRPRDGPGFGAAFARARDGVFKLTAFRILIAVGFRGAGEFEPSKGEYFFFLCMRLKHRTISVVFVVRSETNFL